MFGDVKNRAKRTSSYSLMLCNLLLHGSCTSKKKNRHPCVETNKLMIPIFGDIIMSNRKTLFLGHVKLYSKGRCFQLETVAHPANISLARLALLP